MAHVTDELNLVPIWITDTRDGKFEVIEAKGFPIQAEDDPFDEDEDDIPARWIIKFDTSSIRTKYLPYGYDIHYSEEDAYKHLESVRLRDIDNYNYQIDCCKSDIIHYEEKLRKLKNLSFNK